MAKFRKSFSYRFQKRALKTVGGVFGAAPGTMLDYISTGTPWGGPGQKLGWKYGKKLFWRKPWGKSKPGHYIGSARPIYGSAPGKKPVYGSNPHPPIYGSPPIGPPKIPDPVAYKMEFITPVISPVEKWHKGLLI